MSARAASLWTPEQDALLRELYPTHTQVQLAEALQRTQGAVRDRCWTLRLSDKSPRWTDGELRRLIEAYTDALDKPLDLDGLAEELGKLKSNIARKARGLGLTNQGRKRVEERKVRVPMYDSKEERNAALSEVRKAWIREHGHPRGALGMRHSAETKAKLGQKHRAAWADPNSGHNTEENRQRSSDLMVERIKAGQMPSGEQVYSRTASGKRPDLDNRYFRSSWEANYARFLNLLIQQGVITSWEYEPKTFWFEVIKRGTRGYTPDFLVHYPDGHHEWHEVKGWMDPKSKVRLARMAKFYPEEPVRVIGASWFKVARKEGLPGVIPHWEYGGRKSA